jgi:Putative zincin peptidase
VSLLLVDRYHPQRRREQQAAIDAGHLHLSDELALLGQEQLLPLARMSLWLFLAGGTVFVLFNMLAYHLHTHLWIAPITVWRAILWLVLNIVCYTLVLPLHELIHGVIFFTLGGRPHFGAKLPFALYCGARQQLFRRNAYFVVGLAPLIVISLAGILLIFLVPGLAAYALLAWVGNFAGAAGDILVVRRLLRLPQQVLIEDTEVGYRAWKIVSVL